MSQLLKNSEFNKKWEKTGYFRDYGRTNVHEFFAVAVESYVETPKDFEVQFPKLFQIVRSMLNLGFYKLP